MKKNVLIKIYIPLIVNPNPQIKKRNFVSEGASLSLTKNIENKIPHINTIIPP